MNGLSIVITYYKGKDFIRLCLDSILGSYNNSKKELSLEIILVIDSMEDADEISRTLTELYSPDILKLIRNEQNLGVSESRNVGLRYMRKKFYTIIDQDDLVDPGYFSCLEKELQSDTAVYLINGVVLYQKEQKRVPIYFFQPNFTFQSLILQSTTIYTPGLVIFNSKFIKPEDVFIQTSSLFKGCDDWAAYLNILLGNNISFKFIPHKIFVYCLHDSNYSHNKEEMEQASISVIEYFIAKTEGEGLPELKYALAARQRNQFLFDLRVKKAAMIRLIWEYPKQLMDHYLFSFLKVDRLNRLVFRVRYLFL